MFSSSKAVQVTGNESEIIIGIDKCKVVSLKVNDKETSEGVAYKEMSIWLKSSLGGSANYNIKVSTLDANKAASGKFQFIDQFGNTAWALSVADTTKPVEYKDKKTGEIKSFTPNIDAATVRKAVQGEADFTHFLRKLFNTEKDKPTFSSLSDFTNGKAYKAIVNGVTGDKVVEFAKDWEIYTMFAVYEKQDGNKGNKIIPVFENAISPISAFKFSFKKFVDDKNAQADKAEAEGKTAYRLKDDYLNDKAKIYTIDYMNTGETVTTEPSAMTGSNIDDLPF